MTWVHLITNQMWKTLQHSDSQSWLRLALHQITWGAFKAPTAQLTPHISGYLGVGHRHP